jgi:hypothetical protein
MRGGGGGGGGCCRVQWGCGRISGPCWSMRGGARRNLAPSVSVGTADEEEG